jgi:hypothetical protein
MIETLEEKNEWINAIQQAMKEWHEKSETLQRDDTPRQAPMENFDAPVWMPDGYASSCLVCFKSFSFFVRKVVCNSCSQNSFFITYKDGERQARVCDGCLPTLIRERKFRVSITNSWENLDPDSTSTSESILRSAAIDDSSLVNISRNSIYDVIEKAFDVKSLFRPNSRPSLKRLDFTSIYSMIVGQPKSSQPQCSLCLSEFTISNWNV